MGMFGKLFGGKKSKEVQLEGRDSQRVRLTIPLLASIDGKRLAHTTATNLSPMGLFLNTDDTPLTPDTKVDLEFTGLEQTLQPIRVIGRVAWIASAPNPGAGMEIDREHTDDGELRRYRAMVLYLIRHPNEAGRKQTGSFKSAVCRGCNWSGMVSVRGGKCPKCGGESFKKI